MNYTIGDLAQRTGLTVRTLHHYEQLGLLVPSTRTEGGYRLYGDEDVRTLHRILAYRQIGLALKDIAPLLAPGAIVPLAELLDRQIAAVEATIAAQQRLLTTLQRTARRARDGGALDTDELLRLISAQRILEQHYSAEEIDRLRAVQDGISAADMARFKTEIPRLMGVFRQGLQDGLAATAPAMREAARQWLALETLLPVDEDLRRKGRRMLDADAGFQQMSGLDAALVRFIDAALAAEKQGAPR
ncbi:MerR family transcriptional regulator [Roseateles chitosanitabidus]|jgi:DNA-binding transcriptional MerR regulator|uniref:MerR family transcriptional regulator n=1 Tax=Roseateles chitosanitabidus TaxID=65048 RepID=UPI00082EC70B|nr:MerR family transcriptional regulator [Roseateles chitosanitabidus]MBO9687211.1 MerR family transcriptional regulator [Roseateles chitosanitabidus]